MFSIEVLIHMAVMCASLGGLSGFQVTDVIRFLLFIPMVSVIAEASSSVRGESVAERLNDFYMRLRRILWNEKAYEWAEKVAKLRVYSVIISSYLRNMSFDERRLYGLYGATEVLGLSGELSGRIGRLPKPVSQVAGRVLDMLRTADNILTGEESLEDADAEFKRWLDSEILEIYVFEVGGKHELITLSGAFIDLRGASCFIDVAARTAGDVARRMLGEEFILVDAAGEVVLLAPIGMAQDIEEKIMDVLRDGETLPFGEVLLYRGNAQAGFKVTPRMLLFGEFGRWYRAALVSCKELNLEPDIETTSMGEVCRVCRRNPGMNREQAKGMITHFAGEEAFRDALRLWDPSEAVSNICERCLAVRFYSVLLNKYIGEFLRSPQHRKPVPERHRFITYSSAYQFIAESSLIASKLSAGAFYDPKTLDKYNPPGGVGLYALIHGDGDSFGKLKLKTESVIDFLCLSWLFEDLIRSGFEEGFVNSIRVEAQVGWEEPGGQPIPVILLYAGGDDLLIALRAELMIPFLKGFYQGGMKVIESFRKKSGRQYERIICDKYFGVSFGGVATHTRTPGLPTYESAEEVLRSVKAGVKNTSIEGFAATLGFVYFRAQPSPKYVEFSNPSEGYYPALIWYREDAGTCSLINALRTIYANGRGDGQRITANKLKDYLEIAIKDGADGDGKGSGVYSMEAFVRMVNDAARLVGDNKGRGGRKLADIAEYWLRAVGQWGQESFNPNSYLWLLRLVDVMDIVEDRLKDPSLLEKYAGWI